VFVTVPYNAGVCESVCCCFLQRWNGCKCMLLYPTKLECVGMSVDVPYSVGVCVIVCYCPLQRWCVRECLLLSPTVLEWGREEWASKNYNWGYEINVSNKRQIARTRLSRGIQEFLVWWTLFIVGQ